MKTVSLIELYSYCAGNVFLGIVNEVLHGRPFRRKPVPVVDELSIARHERIPEVHDYPVEYEGPDCPVRCVQNRSARSLIDTSGLYPYISVFDDINPSDTMHAGKCIQHRDVGLKNVTVLAERAESIGALPTHRQQYDWAVARAVANLPVLVEYLLPLVRVGGKALAMKVESGLAEAQLAENGIRVLGGCLHQIIPVTLPGVKDQRYLIVIKKIAATPDQYPRRIGVPAKKPL